MIGLELIGAGADAVPGRRAQQRREDVVRAGIQPRRHHPFQRVLRRMRRRPRRQDHHRRAQRREKDLALRIDRAVMVDDVDVGRADGAGDRGLDRLPRGRAGVGDAGHVAAGEEIEAAIADAQADAAHVLGRPVLVAQRLERREDAGDARRRCRSTRRRWPRRCGPRRRETPRDRGAARSDRHGRPGSVRRSCHGPVLHVEKSAIVREGRIAVRRREIVGAAIDHGADRDPRADVIRAPAWSRMSA